MKKLALLTAVLLGSAMTQAAACDWEKVHASADHTIVACAGGTCVGVPPTTQQEPADGCNGPNCATQEPAAPHTASEPTDPAPTTVADCGNANCP